MDTKKSVQKETIEIAEAAQTVQKETTEAIAPMQTVQKETLKPATVYEEPVKSTSEELDDDVLNDMLSGLYKAG